MTVLQTAYAQRPTQGLGQAADNLSMDITRHAASQATTRGIDPREVCAIVAERTADTRSVAVFCGWAEGFRGASNGNDVWAVVRDGTVVTVMFRRGDQPATPQALRVDRVVR